MKTGSNVVLQSQIEREKMCNRAIREHAGVEMISLYNLLEIHAVMMSIIKHMLTFMIHGQ